jgi:preprotein translocase subunit SecY
MRIFAYVLAAVGSLVFLAGGYFLQALIMAFGRDYPGSPLIMPLITLNLLTGGAVLCGLSMLILRRKQ